jgi:hypothetical protein
MSESCCFILGKALLLVVYLFTIVPQDFCDRVKQELNDILQGAGVANVDNPDFKFPLLFQGMKVQYTLRK